MKTFSVRLPEHWIRELETKLEAGMGFQKVNIYFADKTILHKVILRNGEILKRVPEDCIDKHTNKLKEIKYIQISEDIDNKDEELEDEETEDEDNKKGNIIMETKQQITKFIKNLLDDDFAEANKTLVDITNLKVQDRIKNEIVAQEKAK